MTSVTIIMAKASFGKTRAVCALSSDLIKYEEAIRKLNSLQSNNSVLQEAKQSLLAGDNRRANNVKETVKYLNRLGVSLENLNDKIIHVSGTKGKGSTALLTESLLRSVPYKTGLFISPHLTSVRERIAINGRPLPLSIFVEYFWRVYNQLYQLKEHDEDMPSYFKFLTIMAFKIFTSENVDVAIVEVGIGGELDCTNIFMNTPIVGITSIGLDHTHILGNTVEKIAWQKGGIIKVGSRAFTVPEQKESVLEVLQSRASEREVKLEVVPHLSEYSVNFENLNLPHRLNSSLALQLAKAWEIWKNNKQHQEYERLVVNEREERAVRECEIPGRCQIFPHANSGLTFYLDGAHTIESLLVAKDWFETTSPKKNKKVLIFNVTGNRSVRTFLEILKDCSFTLAIFCSNNVSNKTEDLPPDFIQTNKSMKVEMVEAEENLKTWKSVNPNVRGEAVFTVAEAIALAQQLAPSASILVTGSLHLVGSALSLLQYS